MKSSEEPTFLVDFWMQEAFQEITATEEAELKRNIWHMVTKVRSTHHRRSIEGNVVHEGYGA
ncbi:hypothetical protein R6Q59_008690 [Mikania micrantha]